MEEQNKSEWNLILPILILVSFLFVVLRMNPDSIGFDIRFSSFLIVAVPLAVFPAILIIGQVCKGKDLWKHQLKEG